MTTELTDEPDLSGMTRHEEAWARMEQVPVRPATPARPSAPPPLPRSARRRRPRRRLRRWLVTLLVFAALFGAAFLTSRDFRRTAPPPPAPQVATRVTSTAPLESAVADAQTAVDAARSGLDALTGIPTPASVAPVTDAYGASLRLFDHVLALTSVPASARAAAAAVAAQLHSDVPLLQSVATLPPATLGAYLGDFTARMQRLDTALGSLHDALASTATH